MGTRSHTNFIDATNGDNDLVCTIYQQYDGYVSYLGKNIAEFLSGKGIVNGFSGRDVTQANGIGCLIAQYIAKFKDGIGNLYVMKPKESNLAINGWLEYVYNIYVHEKKQGAEQYRIEVISLSGKIFDGDLDAYVAFVEDTINKENEE